MNLFQKVILSCVFAIMGVFAYKWQKQEKLNDYFVEQFTIDYLIQSSRNEKNCHGEVFEKALADMKTKGYSQDEIYKIMTRGFDKANLILAQQQSDKFANQG